MHFKKSSAFYFNLDQSNILSSGNGLNTIICTLQVFDLQYASPATVSRCGMVYVDPKNLGYLPFWQKWVNGRTVKIEKDNLMRLYEKYVPILIDMVVEGIIDGRQGEKMKTIVPLTNLNMVCFVGFLCLPSLIGLSLTLYLICQFWALPIQQQIKI